ncbi:DHHC palmitoyltransferase-domain-containing protein, partial [Gigaspora rosea]
MVQSESSGLEKWLEENKFAQFLFKIGNYIPVVFLIALVSWSYYAFVIRLCLLYLLNVNPTQGVVYLVLYHPLLVLMMWSYFKATLISPGYSIDPPIAGSTGSHQSISYHSVEQRRSNSAQNSIDSNSPIHLDDIENRDSSFEVPATKPKTIILDENGNPVSVGSIMVKQSGEKRYCQKCQHDKPDRTHHCRVCKKCVLKMDHHCPWLNNCIGFRNHKYFYLFIVWGTIYCFFVTFATLPPTIQYAQSSYEAIISLDLNWSFLILIGGIFGLCLIGFAVYHTSLLFSNQTTLESLTKHNYKIKDDGDVTTSKFLNLFDIGKRANFIQVMGPEWYFWFIPIGNSLGDGRSWPLNSYKYSTLCESVENLTK